MSFFVSLGLKIVLLHAGNATIVRYSGVRSGKIVFHSGADPVNN